MSMTVDAKGGGRKFQNLVLIMTLILIKLITEEVSPKKVEPLLVKTDGWFQSCRTRVLLALAPNNSLGKLEISIPP